MDWKMFEPLLAEAQYIILALITAAGAFGLRLAIRWMKQSRNKMLNFIGDLAHQEIEDTMQTNDGKEKMEAAIKVARKEMEKRKVFISLSNTQIQNIIQEAWERSNKDKNTPQ